MNQGKLTCGGCGNLATKEWEKGDTAYRCFAPGRYRGYVIDINRFPPERPAWCPMMEEVSNEKG